MNKSRSVSDRIIEKHGGTMYIDHTISGGHDDINRLE